MLYIGGIEYTRCRSNMPLVYVLASIVAILYACSCFHILVGLRFNVLRNLPGPPVTRWFGNHLQHVLDPFVSRKAHEIFVQLYGRTMRIRGLGLWDERLLTLDPVSFSHIVKNPAIYQKPWQSRRLITSLIGCGMLAAEGHVHKRQRRVALPAFTAQNMRSLVDISFRKGIQLRDAWMNLIRSETESTCARIDVCEFVSRATLDVMGLAGASRFVSVSPLLMFATGFDYNFNSIEDETNEVFIAYRDMFEVAVSQSPRFRSLLLMYLPTINRLFPDKTVRTVQQSREVIHRVAGRLIQEKKRKIFEGEKSGPYEGTDLLTLLLKSNAATDLPPEQRLSDEDILSNINTFMFAGSDTSSLSVTWTLFLLAQNPKIQNRLRTELLSVAHEFPGDLSHLTEDQIQTLHTTLCGLPFLHNVTRESLRLIPPVHSSLRVATQDNEVPTMYPIHERDGTVNETRRSFIVPKGTVVHLPFEAFNLDKCVWGEDAWDFKPDRWDNLPDIVQQCPWHFSNILTFSAGPRASMSWTPFLPDRNEDLVLHTCDQFCVQGNRRQDRSTQCGLDAAISKWKIRGRHAMSSAGFAFFCYIVLSRHLPHFLYIEQ
ncbi:Leukotriene-B(4) omega-hydroxylase 2 [Mycena sanguinolenta]|uniref:Leukotriene-B(4) omega-hydroxylase 2 n=1 Tax=Mycena sanguinolenta TaxID=230812 RepID=A0A8H7D1K5_9AGAR|nr:Leukotriene-B(4) omega-hydroxylase 2 [Mycena sanguinolenta]